MPIENQADFHPMTGLVKSSFPLTDISGKPPSPSGLPHIRRSPGLWHVFRWSRPAETATSPRRSKSAATDRSKSAARSLIPSIITVCRTRAYSYTVFIPCPLPTHAEDSNCRSFTPAQPNQSAASVRDYCSGFYNLAANCETAAAAHSITA